MASKKDGELLKMLHGKKEILNSQLINVLFSRAQFGCILLCQDKVKYVNKKFTEILGYKLKDIPDIKSWQNKVFLNEKDKAFFLTDETSRKRNKKSVRIQKVLDKNKNILSVKFSYHFLPDGCTIIFLEDLTKVQEDSKKLKNTSRMFEEIFNSSNDAIYLWKLVSAKNKQIKLIEVNEAALNMLEYSKEEMLTKTPYDLNPQSHKKNVNSALKDLLKNGSKRFITKHLSKSGKLIDVEVNSRLIKIDNKKYIISITRDISDSLNYQKKLIESENKYLNIINSMPFGVHIYELKKDDLIFVGYNNSANEILCIDNKIFLNKRIEDAFPPLAQTEIPIRYKHTAKTGERWHKIFFNYQDDKLLGIFNINTFQISEGLLAVVFNDVSERILNDKALRESEERYKTFINHISEGIWRVDFENPIPISLPIEEQIHKLMYESSVGECNEIFARMYGFQSTDEILGKSLIELYGGNLNELNTQTNREFILNNYRIDNSITLEYTKDGEEKYFLNNAFGIIKDNFLTNIWGTQLDITENKRFEKTNSILAGIIESTSDIVVTFTSDGKISYLNESGEKYVGIRKSEINSHTIDDIFSADDIEKIKSEAIRIADDYGLWQGEIKIIGAIKNEIPCSIVLISHTSTLPEQKLFSAIIRDISEQKQIENSLIENQIKFRSIFENSFDGMLVLQYDKIIDCNRATEELFQFSKEEIIGKTPFFFSPEFQENGIKSEIYGREIIQKTYEETEQYFDWIHLNKSKQPIFTEVSLKKFEFGNSKYLLGIIRDVTHKKIANDLLRKSEELNRRLVESSPLGIIYVDKSGIINYENPASLMMMGLDPTKESPLLGKNLLDLPGLKSIYAYELLKKLMGGATLRGEELKFKSITGKEIDIRIFAAPMLNDQHKYVGAIIMFQDVTESVKIQKALAETESTLKLIIDNSPVIAYEIDLSGIITFWEGKGIPGFIKSSSEIIGKSIFDIFKEYSEFIEANKRALNGNSVSEIYDFSGTFLDAHISPIISHRNYELLGVIGIAFDITDRKKKDDILYNLSVGISTKTGTEFIISVLKYLSKIFSLDMIYIGDIKDEKVSTTYVIKKEEVADNFAYHLKNTPCKNVSNNKAVCCNGNVQNLYPEDQMLIDMGINSYFGITLFDSHQQPMGIFVALKKDKFDNPEFFESVARIFALRISSEIERINYEKEMLKALDAADRANKLKSEFLAQMSHEIRTPINTILSFASLIKEDLSDHINDELKPSFNAMDNAGRRIIRTIDLILNMSEIHTGSYEPYFTEFNLMDLVDNVYLEMMLLAKNKGIELILDSQDDEYLMYADNYTVGQIINNLVDNAIKYTQKGKVEIKVHKNENEAIVVEIEDTGIGISKEYLPYLFTAFSQEETGYTRKFEGNGLGLALVKSYCEINNATIQVESEKNVGTKFTVTFNGVKFN